MRRDALRDTSTCPGARYVLYGLDQLQAAGYTAQHNLTGVTAPSRWVARMACLAGLAIKFVGGSSGDFQTVLKERRRCRQAYIVVSTVDNVGVPLVFLNFFKLLQRPLLYISIGLPERISANSPLRSYWHDSQIFAHRHGAALYAQSGYPIRAIGHRLAALAWIASKRLIHPEKPDYRI
ncbi:MAG: hypothetical protein WCL49_07675 [bacterium]